MNHETIIYGMLYNLKCNRETCEWVVSESYFMAQIQVEGYIVHYQNNDIVIMH